MLTVATNANATYTKTEHENMLIIAM